MITHEEVKDMYIYDDDIKIINNEIYYKGEKLGQVLKRLKNVEQLLKLYELFKYKIRHQEKAYYLLDEIDKLEKELEELK